VTVQPYRNLDDALRLANDTRYGLQAAIYTRDIDDALRAARTLDYGGVRDSGNTREGPQWAVREMTEERVVIITLP
jgi:acyl-CoA reductase-like NAD-dependent aldehyde dehydrogenase